ncbi:MAG: hypothetical protein ACJKTH_02705 [Patescibacteria group bacterium UBA2163]
MFKKMKNMALRAMMAKQLKGMPKEMQDKMIAMVEKNPEFFEKMAKEIKARTDRGEDQMMAMQAVAKEHQAELQQMMLSQEK